MTDYTEDGVWNAYMHAYTLNAKKPGSNSDTQLLAGLMAVYQLGYKAHEAKEEKDYQRYRILEED